MDDLVQAQLALNLEDPSARPGFDEQFLGVTVGIPRHFGVESVLLPYTHFSVLVRLDKRLAAVAGSEWTEAARANIDMVIAPRLSGLGKRELRSRFAF